jgi:hypothetical protein
MNNIKTPISSDCAWTVLGTPNSHELNGQAHHPNVAYAIFILSVISVTIGTVFFPPLVAAAVPLLKLSIGLMASGSVGLISALYIARVRISKSLSNIFKASKRTELAKKSTITSSLNSAEYSGL